MTFAGRAHDGIGQWVLAALVQAGRKAQHLYFVKTRGSHRAIKRRFTLRQRAGFIDDQGINFSQILNCSGIAEKNAMGGTTPGGDHDGHRCGQAQRTGAGDDQNRNCVNQGINPAWLGTEQAPSKKSEQGNADNCHHEPPRYGVSHSLHRCFGALRLGHHLNDLREHGGRADFFRPHHERAIGVESCSNHLVANSLRHWHGFTGQHGFIDGATALGHYSINWNFFAGANA